MDFRENMPVIIHIIVFRSPTAVLIGLLDGLLQNVESVVRVGGLPESN